MKGRHLGLTVSTLVLLLSACGSGQPTDQTSSSPAQTSSSSSAAPVATPAAPKSGVMLRWEGNAQIELTAKGAPRVLIDVWGPSDLSTPATADDILLTTHTHPDHTSPDFLKSFPGTQLFVKEGTVEKPGVAIRSIAAIHTEGQQPAPEGGTDYIFIVDMGGLRIAHMGDLGQARLTPEQVKALGHVDIAIMQFDNSFSQIDAKNKRGFKVMEQLKPRLVVQTHSSLDAVKYAATLWPILYSKRAAVNVTAARVPKQTSLLLLGPDGGYYAEQVPAQKVHW